VYSGHMTSTRIAAMIEDSRAAHRAQLADRIRQHGITRITCVFISGFDEPGFDVEIGDGEILWDLSQQDAINLLRDADFLSSVASQMVGYALRTAERPRSVHVTLEPQS
jgi:hypothetical protein